MHWGASDASAVRAFTLQKLLQTAIATFQFVANMVQAAAADYPTGYRRIRRGRQRSDNLPNVPRDSVTEELHVNPLDFIRNRRRNLVRFSIKSTLQTREVGSYEAEMVESHRNYPLPPFGRGFKCLVTMRV